MKNIILAIIIVLVAAVLCWSPIAAAYNQSIYEAQQKLEELGYDPGEADGIRGDKTVTAIKLFQEDSGLPPTGLLDEQTKTKLKAQRAPSQFSLHEAVLLNDPILIKALIEGGADVNARDKLGTTPLHVAGMNGYREIASLLIEQGADVNAGDVRELTPVHAAAWTGYRDTVALLITHGANIDARDKDGLTPLHTAALAGRTDTVALLIEMGADVNAKNKIALTPLHAAALAGYRETVALLIAKGADVDVRSKDGLTPLQLASQKKHLEVVKLLQEHQSQDK